MKPHENVKLKFFTVIRRSCATALRRSSTAPRHFDIAVEALAFDTLFDMPFLGGRCVGVKLPSTTVDAGINGTGAHSFKGRPASWDLRTEEVNA